jgi:hypothetical protein
MKHLIVICLLAGLGAQLAAPAFAAHRRVVVHKGPRRTVVVVHHRHPIRRALPVVVIRPARVVRVAPVVFLAPVVWTAAVLAVPAGKTVVWSRSERLEKDEEWVDFSLDCDHRGDAMFVDIEGRAQLNFAEVVFDNGDTQVVDFKEYTRGPGHYSLLKFRDGHRVDHVRMVARARSPEARITLDLVS